MIRTEALLARHYLQFHKEPEGLKFFSMHIAVLIYITYGMDMESDEEVDPSSKEEDRRYGILEKPTLPMRRRDFKKLTKAMEKKKGLLQEVKTFDPYQFVYLQSFGYPHERQLLSHCSRGKHFFVGTYDFQVVIRYNWQFLSLVTGGLAAVWQGVQCFAKIAKHKGLDFYEPQRIVISDEAVEIVLKCLVAKNKPRLKTSSELKHYSTDPAKNMSESKYLHGLAKHEMAHCMQLSEAIIDEKWGVADLTRPCFWHRARSAVFPYKSFVIYTGLHGLFPCYSFSSDEKERCRF